MLATLAPHLVNGVALGLLFALLALGFMLIVGANGDDQSGPRIVLRARALRGANDRRADRCRRRPQRAWLALPLAVRYGIALVLAPAIVGVLGMVLELALRRTYGKRSAVWRCC